MIGEEGADYEKLIKAHEQKSSGGASKKEDKEEKKEKSEDKSSESKSASSSAKPTPPVDAANKEKSGEGKGRIFASPWLRKLPKTKGLI